MHVIARYYEFPISPIVLPYIGTILAALALCGLITAYIAYLLIRRLKK